MAVSAFIDMQQVAALALELKKCSQQNKMDLVKFCSIDNGKK